MRIFEVQYQSAALGGDGEYCVLLPDRWQENADTLKVLFLLHGAFSEYKASIIYSSIPRLCENRNMAIVAPTCHLGVYTDMEYGENSYSMLKEVVDLSVKMFPVLPTDPKRRFILGISMGGHGAYKLAMERPNDFNSVAACSSPIDVVRTMTLLETGRHPGGAELYHAFGSSERYRGTQGDVIEMARRHKENGDRLPRLFLCWGDEDHARFEDAVTVEKFKALSIPLTTRMGKGGHNFDMWDPLMEGIIDWLLEGGEEHGAD